MLHSNKELQLIKRIHATLCKTYFILLFKQKKFKYSNAIEPLRRIRPKKATQRMVI